jgi:transposase
LKTKIIRRMSAPAVVDVADPASRKRKYHAHSDDMHACVLTLRAKGMSWSEIEETTKVKKRTAQHWVEVQEAEGRTAKKPKGGNHHSVYSASVREQAVSVQENDAALRLFDIQQKISPAAGEKPPSLKTISNWLRSAGFTTKGMQKYATQRNTVATKEKRKQWVTDVGVKLTAETAVFIDESPFSMTMMRSRGRSRRGQPALGVVPAIRGKNHSVIAAISPTAGLLHFVIHTTQPDVEFISKRKGSKKKKTAPKGVTRDVFRSFLIGLLALPFFSDTSVKRTLLFDNAAIHGGDISDVIFSSGHTPQPLAPWSAELNPIEYAFSAWKFAYRVHYPPDEDSVNPAIRASAAIITPEKCQHWFEHTKHLYASCLALEDL